MRVSEYMEQAELFKGVVALIEDANTIAICAHTSPDGDAIGSGLALAEVIRTAWPGKRVTNLLADKDPVPGSTASCRGPTPSCTRWTTT